VKTSGRTEGNLGLEFNPRKFRLGDEQTPRRKKKKDQRPGKGISRSLRTLRPGKGISRSLRTLRPGRQLQENRLGRNPKIQFKARAEGRFREN